MTNLLRLAEEEDAQRFIPETLPWIHEAGNPYFDWIFGGSESARGHLADWMKRDSSEVSIRRVILLREKGTGVAGFVALSGVDLAGCRKADSLALAKIEPAERQRLLTRMSAARGLFPPVDPGEFYLSKMGVLPVHRGRGLGRRLVETFLEVGENARFRRFRLDVARENRLAKELYASFGFEVTQECSSENGRLAYAAMTWNKPVP